jgi:simple sugar transport system permease protein
MIASGSNPRYATSCGISVDRSRIIGTVLSTVLGGVGVIVYAQSFGFLQLYQGPMMMGFPAVAGILIGGASFRKASIANVLIGTFLFQSILVSSMPVANKLAADVSNLAEITRLIIQNGIILYALAQAARQE